MSRRASPRSASASPHNQGLEISATHSIEGSKNNAVRTAEMATESTVWTAEWDGTIRIRRLPLGNDIDVLEKKDKTTFVTTLLLVERRMWAALSDGAIRIYDPVSARLLYEFKQHDGAVNCLTQVAGRVYSAGNDWKVFQWRLAPNKVPEYERLFFGHTNAVKSLCGYCDASGEHTLIFSGGDDALIKAWDPHSPKQTEKDIACAHTFAGHTKSVLSLERVPNRHQLWSGGEDSAIHVWDIKTFRHVMKLDYHQGPVTSLQFVDTRMWSVGKDGLVFVWDINQLAPITQVGPQGMHVSDTYVLNVKRLFRTYLWKVWTFAFDGSIQCWNADVPGDEYEVEYDEHEKTNKALIDGLRETLMDETAELNMARDKIAELQQRLTEIQGEGFEDELEATRQQLELVIAERDEIVKQRDLFTSRFEMANELLVSTRQQLKESEANCVQAQDENTKLKETIQTLESVQDENKQRTVKAEDLASEHTAQLEEAQKAIEELEKKLKQAQAELESSDTEKENTISTLRDEVENVSKSRDEAVTSAQKSLEELEAVKAELQNSKSEWSEAKSALEEQLEKAKEETAEEHRQRAALEKELHSTTSELKDAQEKHDELEATTKEHVEQVHEEHQRKLSENVETSEERVAYLEEELSSKSAENKTLEDEKQAAKARVEELEKSIKQLRDESATVHKKLSEELDAKERTVDEKERTIEFLKLEQAAMKDESKNEVSREMSQHLQVIEERNQDIKKLKSDISAKKSELQKASREKQDALDEAAANQKEANDLKEELLKSREKSMAARDKEKKTRNQLEELRAEHDHLKTESEREVSELRRSLQDSRRERERLTRQVSTNSKLSEDTQMRQDEDNRRIVELEQRLTTEAAVTEEVQRKLDFMVDENRKLEKENAALTALKEQQQDQLAVAEAEIQSMKETAPRSPRTPREATSRELAAPVKEKTVAAGSAVDTESGAPAPAPVALEVTGEEPPSSVLQEEVDELKKRNAVLEEQLDEEKQTTTTVSVAAEQEVSALREQLSTLTQEVKASQEEVAEAKKQHTASEAELQKVKEELVHEKKLHSSNVNEAMAEQQKHTDELQQKLDAAEKQVEMLETKASSVEESSKEQHAEKEAATAALRQEVEVLQQEKQDAVARVEELEKDTAQHTQVEEQLFSENEALVKEKRVLVNTVERLETDVERLAAASETAQMEMEALRGEKKENDRELEEVTVQLEEEKAVAKANLQLAEELERQLNERAAAAAMSEHFTTPRANDDASTPTVSRSISVSSSLMRQDQMREAEVAAAEAEKQKKAEEHAAQQQRFIEELEQHIVTAKQQAETANAKNKSLEEGNKNLANQKERLEQLLDETKADLHTQRGVVSELSQQKESLMTDWKEGDRRVVQLEGELATTQKELETLQGDVVAKEVQHAQMTDDGKSLAKAHDDLQKEAAMLKQSIAHERDLHEKETEGRKAAEGRIEKMESENKTLHEDVVTLRADLAQRQRELDALNETLNKDREEKFKTISEKSSEAQEASMSVSMLTKEKVLLEKEVADLKTQLEQAQQERETAKNDASTKAGEAQAARDILTKDLSEMKERAESARDENQQLFQQLGEKSAECASMQEKMSAATQQVKTLEPELTDAKQKINVLEVENKALEERLERETSSLKEQLQLLEQNSDASRSDALKLVHDAHQRADQQAQRITELEVRRTELESQIVAKDAAIADGFNANEELEAQLADARHELEDLFAGRDQHIADMDDLREQLAQMAFLEEQKESLSSEVSVLVLKNEQLDEDLKVLKDELDSKKPLDEAIAQKESVIADLQTLVDERHESIALLNKKLDERGAEVAELQKKNKSLSERIADNNAHIDKMETDLVELHSKHEAAEQTIKSLSSKEEGHAETARQLKEQADRISFLEGSLKNSETDKKQLEEKLVEFAGTQEKLNDANEHIDALEKELSDHLNRIDDLEKQAADGRDFATVCSNLRTEKAEAETALTEEKKQHAVEIEALTSKLDEAQDANEKLLEDNQKLASEQVTLHEQLSEFDKAQQLLTESSLNLEALSSEHQRATHELAAAQEENEALKLQLKNSGPLTQAEYEATLRDLEKQVDRRCTELEQSQLLLAKVEVTLSEEQATISLLTDRIKNLTEKEKVDEATLESFMKKTAADAATAAKVSALEGLIKAKDAKIGGQERNVCNLQSRLKLLESSSTIGGTVRNDEGETEAATQEEQPSTALIVSNSSPMTANSIGARTYTMHLAKLVETLEKEVADQTDQRVQAERILTGALEKVGFWRGKALQVLQLGTSTPGEGDLNTLIEEIETPRIVELKQAIAALKRANRRLQADIDARNEAPYLSGMYGCASEFGGFDSAATSAQPSAAPSQRPSTNMHHFDAADPSAHLFPPSSNPASRSASQQPSMAGGAGMGSGSKMLALVTGNSSGTAGGTDPSAQLRFILSAKSQKLNGLQKEIDRLQAEILHKDQVVTALVRGLFRANSKKNMKTLTDNDTAAADEATIADLERRLAELATKNAKLQGSVATLQESLTAAQVALSSGATGDAQSQVLVDEITELRAAVEQANSLVDQIKNTAEVAAEQVVSLRLAVEHAQTTRDASEKEARTLTLERSRMEGRLKQAADAIDRQSIVVEGLEETKHHLEAELSQFKANDDLLKKWLKGEGYPEEEGASMMEQLREVHTKWQDCVARLNDDDKRVKELQDAADVATTDSRKLLAELEDATTANEALEKRVAALDDEKQFEISKLKDALSRIDTLTTQNDALNAANRKNEDELALTKKEVEILKDQAKTLDATASTSRAEADAQAKKLVEAETKIDTLTKENAKRDSALDEMRRNNAAMRDNYEKREETFSTIESEIERYAEIIAAHDAEKETLEDELHRAKKSEAGLRKDIEDQQSAHNKTKCDMEERMRSLKHETDVAKDRSTALQREVDAVRDHLRDANESVKSLTGRLALSDSAKEHLHNQIAALEERMNTNKEELFEEEQETVLQLRSACAKLGVELTGAETSPLELATVVLDYAAASSVIALSLEKTGRTMGDTVAAMMKTTAAYGDSSDDEDEENDKSADQKAFGDRIEDILDSPRLRKTKLATVATHLYENARDLSRRCAMFETMRVDMEGQLQRTMKKIKDLTDKNKQLREAIPDGENGAIAPTAAQANNATELKNERARISATVIRMKKDLQGLLEGVRRVNPDKGNTRTSQSGGTPTRASTTSNSMMVLDQMTRSDIYEDLLQFVNPLAINVKDLLAEVKHWQASSANATLYGETTAKPVHQVKAQ